MNNNGIKKIVFGIFLFLIGMNVSTVLLNIDTALYRMPFVPFLVSGITLILMIWGIVLGILGFLQKS